MAIKCSLISFIILIPHHCMQDKSVAFSHNFNSSTEKNLAKVSLTVLETMNTEAIKPALSQILRTFSVEERFMLTKIYVPELVDTLKQLLPNLNKPNSQPQNKSEHEKNAKNDSLGSTQYYKTPQNSKNNTKGRTLCDSLVFLSDGLQHLDHLSFEYSILENTQKLIDCLTYNIVDPNVRMMREALEADSKSESIAYQLRKCKSRDEFEDRLTTYLRSQILLRVRKGLLDEHLYYRQLQDQKKVKKEFNNYWKCLAEEQKRRLLLLDCKDLDGLAYHLSQRNEQIGLGLIQQELKLLLRLNKNQFCNRIFKCKMKYLFQPLFDYHRHIYFFWKKQIQASRRKRIPKAKREDRDYNSEHKNENRVRHEQGRKKKGKMRKTISLESNQTNETERQLKQKSLKSPQKMMKEDEFDNRKKGEYFHVPSDRSEEDRKEKREAICSVQKDEWSIRSSKVKSKGQKYNINKLGQLEQQKNPQLFTCQQNKKQETLSSYTTFSSEGSLKYPLKGWSTLSEQEIKATTLNKLDSELSEMSDLISEQANQYYERRIVAFERIQWILQHYSIPIKLFGSCANGIAVKNSDIDIAIDQSILQWIENIPENQKVRYALEWLQQTLKNYPCFKEIKLIKTAAIPVMKLTVDTSVVFVSQDFYSLNRSHNSGPIQADITIQTYSFNNQSSHQGIQTTAAITHWLTSMRPLHTIVIFLKQFFTLNRLNLAYQNGLNTISMIVMLVAYITHAKLDNEQNVALVLQKMLSFYVYEFDEKTYGIDLLQLNGLPIYYKKDDYVEEIPNKIKADLEIRDPLCAGKNMTKNCYNYDDIKSMFKTMLEKCYSKALDDSKGLALKEGHLETLSETFSKRNLFLQLHKAMGGKTI